MRGLFTKFLGCITTKTLYNSSRTKSWKCLWCTRRKEMVILWSFLEPSSLSPILSAILGKPWKPARPSVDYYIQTRFNFWSRSPFALVFCLPIMQRKNTRKEKHVWLLTAPGSIPQCFTQTLQKGFKHPPFLPQVPCYKRSPHPHPFVMDG